MDLFRCHFKHDPIQKWRRVAQREDAASKRFVGYLSGNAEKLFAGRFHFQVHLFRAGAIDGTARPESGSELRWALPREIDPHPNLAVALVDLGLIDRERAALERDLARLGIEMRRV